jgi:hypothetical protein
MKAGEGQIKQAKQMGGRSVMHRIIFYFHVVFHAVLYCTVLHRTALYCTALLHYTVALISVFKVVHLISFES